MKEDDGLRTQDKITGLYGITCNNDMSEHTEIEVFETGLYANVYQNLNEGGLEVGKYYNSPMDAEKNINWDQLSLKYVFTAKMSHKIFTFKKSEKL